MYTRMNRLGSDCPAVASSDTCHFLLGIESDAGDYELNLEAFPKKCLPKR